MQNMDIPCRAILNWFCGRWTMDNMINMDMIAMTLLHLVDSCGISELSCVSAPETRLLLCLIRYLGGLLRWLHSKSFTKHGIQRGRRGVLQRCSGCPCRRSSNAAAEGSGESLLALECSVGTVDKVLGLPCDPMVGFSSLSHLLHLMFHEFLRMFRLVVDFNRWTRVIKLNRPA